MEEKVFTCIVCPMSCTITVMDDNGHLETKGNSCPRGAQFAKDEYICPKRMLTSTVVVENGIISRLPVISSQEIEKALLPECLKEVYRVKVKAPVKCRDVIIENILNTGVNIVAARDLDEK